jgi:hypothetical protein
MRGVGKVERGVQSKCDELVGPWRCPSQRWLRLGKVGKGGHQCDLGCVQPWGSGPEVGPDSHSVSLGWGVQLGATD